MAGKDSVFSCVSSKKTVFNLQSLRQPYFDYILRQGKRREKCAFAPSHAYFVFFADTMTDTDCDTWAHYCLPCSATHSLIYFFTFVPVRRWGMVVCDCRLYWILFVRKTLRWKFNYMKVMVSSVCILVFQSTLMSNYLEAKVSYAFSILKTKFGLVLTKARIR